MSIRIPICLLILVLVSATASLAQVKTDGTLGPASGMLSGANLHIAPTLGRQVGPNLFHFFDQFNISSGQSVTFDGPPNVHNVLARVTGGTPSAIDGTLACSIKSADLYLINPAGVVFGPGAALDLKGSFTVDGPAGGRIAVIAGDVTLDDHSVFSASTRGDESGHGIAISADSLILRTGSRIAASALSGRGAAGDINISAALVSLTGTDEKRDTAIVSDSATRANGRGGDLFLTADSLTLRSGAQVVTSTRGAATGGNVCVTAKSLLIDGSGPPTQSDTGIEAISDAAATGSGGRLSVIARDLTVRASGTVTADTFGAGRGGDVTINARSITLDGRGGSDDAFTGISTDSLAESGPAGRGGRLAIRAKSLAVLAGANVSADSVGRGAGGDLTIQAGAVTIDGKGTDQFTGISTVTLAESGSAGPGGRLTIGAQTVTIWDAGSITADTSRRGAGGDVSIDADTITIDRASSDTFTGISTDALGSHGRSGAGGRLAVHARSLELRDGAQIAADTYGPGRGGDVRIVGSEITVEGQGAEISSISYGQAEDAASGGRLDITGPFLHVVARRLDHPPHIWIRPWW